MSGDLDTEMQNKEDEDEGDEDENSDDENKDEEDNMETQAGILSLSPHSPLVITVCF